MPEPSDLIMALSPQPGRCFPMVQSRQLQATHRRQQPAWNGVGGTARAAVGTCRSLRGARGVDHQRRVGGLLNRLSHQASNVCEWKSKAVRRSPRRPNAASILPRGWVRARRAVSATAAHVFQHEGNATAQILIGTRMPHHSSRRFTRAGLKLVGRRQHGDSVHAHGR
jgi:hypothetical protein